MCIEKEIKSKKPRQGRQYFFQLNERPKESLSNLMI